MTWRTRLLNNGKIANSPRALAKSVLVISTAERRCGVAVYDESLSIELARHNSLQLGHLYLDRNDLLMPLRVLSKAARFRTVHIQFEFLLYGSPYLLPLLMLTIIFQRLAGKNVIVTMHSTLPVKALEEAFRIYGYPRAVPFQARAGRSFLRVFGKLATKYVVHLSHAKSVLVNDYNFPEEKVSIIPHGISGGQA